MTSFNLLECFTSLSHNYATFAKIKSWLWLIKNIFFLKLNRDNSITSCWTNEKWLRSTKENWKKFTRDFFLKKGPTPASFSFIFVFSNKHCNSYNKQMWKNVHPASGAGIQTHNLLITNLLPEQLDQGSGPLLMTFWEIICRCGCKLEALLEI